MKVRLVSIVVLLTVLLMGFSFSAEAQTCKTVYHVVKPGDRLSKIAKSAYDNAGDYMRIFEANKDILKNPDLIHPGQRLKLPNKA